MYYPEQVTAPVATAISTPTRSRGCLVDGCACKDARIVSHRRAAFFAAMARQRGETADRSIAPDPAWRLPFEAVDVDPIFE